MKLRVAVALLSIGMTQPAFAQLFWKAPDFTGAPIAVGEQGIGIALPGATPEEERASLAWQMRAGLNVAALQCQFDKTLLTENAYNVILTNHKAELEASYKTIAAYFTRTIKNKKAAQAALDTHGTKTYSGFSTVRAQLGFCQTASTIMQSAIFTPRGSFSSVAVERLRELRNSLAFGSEQYFRFGTPDFGFLYPQFTKKCWDGKGRYKARCGLVA